MTKRITKYELEGLKYSAAIQAFCILVSGGLGVWLSVKQESAMCAEFFASCNGLCSCGSILPFMLLTLVTISFMTSLLFYGWSLEKA